MKQNRLTVLCIGVAFLGVFVVFSRQIKRGAMRQIDFDVTVKVQDQVAKLGSSNRIARFDSFMEDIGFFASPGFSTMAVAALTFWQFIDVKRKRVRFRALIIPIAFVFLVLVELYGKSVVTHPAPPFFMLKNPTTVFPTYHVWEEFSYPSGHAARAMFIALIVSRITYHEKEKTVRGRY